MIVGDFSFQIAIRRDESNGKLRPRLFCSHATIAGVGFHGFVEAQDLEKIGRFFLSEASKLSGKEKE